MIYYAYVHCKPDGTPFYVGKGVRARYKDFIYRNQYHKRVVAKYGRDNILVGRMECSTNEISLSLEVGLIKCLKRMGVRLTNLTEGGEGAVGRECSINVRKAVAEANKRRVLTEEQRHRLGNLTRGKKRPNHSTRMKELGLIAGDKNPFYGSGYKQLGENNHMAKAVVGYHVEHGTMEWPTLKAASEFIGVSIQAVCQAIRKKQRSKGWDLEYK